MLPDSLECRFNGPVPRALVYGAAVDETVLRCRQAAQRAQAVARIAARARADIAHLRRFAPTAAALSRSAERLAWARHEAESWRRLSGVL
jgi:hypothetical protein